MLTPITGMPLSPTAAADFSSVPSPPMDITKSASKSLPSNTVTAPMPFIPPSERKAWNILSMRISAP